MVAAIDSSDVRESYTKVGDIRYYRAFAGVVAATGGAKVESVVKLPRNALLRPATPGGPSPWVVTVRAGGASWTFAAGVCQLRPASGSSFVLDFGMLRTVAGVGSIEPATLGITGVKPWQGAGFGKSDIPAASKTMGAYQFDSEVRTERLLVTLSLGSGRGETLDSAVRKLLAVELPEAPADLDLRINGGPPVWTSPGPVVKGAPGWTPVPDTTLFRQDIDLGAALTALLAQPSTGNAFDTELRLTLSARVPGALELATPPDDPKALEYLVPIDAPPPGIVLEFGSEGLQSIPLSLPNWVAAVGEVRALVVGEPPPERVLPAVGPAATLLPDGTQPLVELWLDPDRAAALELPTAQKFKELTGIRLPAYTDARGAEISVLLLAGGEEPGAPIDGAVSRPVTLEAGQSDTDTWLTAAFPRPVPIDPASPPYAAVLVTRGRIGMALSGETTASRIWLGPPTGSWSVLPALAGVSALRGRARVVGKAPRDVSIAPFTAQVIGVGDGALEPAVELQPVPKGVAAVIPAQAVPTSSGSGVSLDIIGQVTGSGLTLRNLMAVVRSK